MSANGRRSTHASGRWSKEAGLRIARSIREVLMPVLLHRSSHWTRERTRQSSSVDRPTRDRSEVGLRPLFITRCSTYYTTVRLRIKVLGIEFNDLQRSSYGYLKRGVLSSQSIESMSMFVNSVRKLYDLTLKIWEASFRTYRLDADR
jgi:hypothetical protein